MVFVWAIMYMVIRNGNHNDYRIKLVPSGNFCIMMPFIHPGAKFWGLAAVSVLRRSY